MEEFLINNYQLLGILVTAVISFMGWIIARKTERIKIIESQLSEKKYKAYADAVKMIYSTLEDTKTNKNIDPKEQLKTMLSVKRDIFMYGSDKVFRCFNDWLVCSSQNVDNKTMMKKLLVFMLEIRKDLRNGDTNLTVNDILLNITQSQEEVQKLK